MRVLHAARFYVAWMDLCHLPAHELVRLMTGGSVSCREVTRAHLEQIERVNPTLNALVEAADPEECLRLAGHADECAARGEPLGAAHGLAVVVKDVLKVAGLACSGGSRALRAVAHTDAAAPNPTTAFTAAPTIRTT
jgi:amidase